MTDVTDFFIMTTVILFMATCVFIALIIHYYRRTDKPAESPPNKPFYRIIRPDILGKLRKEHIDYPMKTGASPKVIAAEYVRRDREDNGLPGKIPEYILPIPQLRMVVSPGTSVLLLHGFTHGISITKVTREGN